MNTDIILKVTAESQLELPPEIRAKLRPGDEYKASVTENSIIFEKITKPTVDLNKFLQQLEELEPDPNQPTLQEISDVVKEVRREPYSNK